MATSYEQSVVTRTLPAGSGRRTGCMGASLEVGEGLGECRGVMLYRAWEVRLLGGVRAGEGGTPNGGPPPPTRKSTYGHESGARLAPESTGMSPLPCPRMSRSGRFALWITRSSCARISTFLPIRPQASSVRFYGASRFRHASQPCDQGERRPMLRNCHNKLLKSGTESADNIGRKRTHRTGQD